MEEYLQSELDVPKSQITSLRNSQATRRMIIQEIQNFGQNPTIKFGDPILIYYAGHGGETSAPPGWDCEGSKTQMVIPYDCEAKVDGEIIHGIPDRTFGWLLKQLADKKGNNITVILDNCFSGSGTRAGKLTSEPSSRLHRGIRIASGFVNGGLKSHVLLAACSAGEYAREALSNLDIERVTYR
ncbi:hypothetical protein BDZ97DRAFT_1828302 [Flammula alnicola]|nr:hypothetical protein BDZ97DRAFT_1828302 [Flammula alnicola]